MRLFTLEEARGLIPSLTSSFHDFQEKFDRMEVSAGIRQSQIESARLEKEIIGVLHRIESLGCVIRDPHQGLVDFPAIRDQQPVYLCWKLGEETVRFYHGADDGFAGRKPI